MRDDGSLKGNANGWWKLGIEGLALTVLLELINHRSFIATVTFIGASPLIFALNVLIVLCTFLPTQCIRRRYAARLTVGLVWLLFGIVNYVLKGLRTQPFTFIDLTMALDSLPFIPIYLKPWQIAAISVAAVLWMTIWVMGWIRLPRAPRGGGWSAFLLTCGGIGITIVAIQGGIHTHLLPNRMDHLSDAYQQYGFAYCLVMTLDDVGIEMPDAYGEPLIDQLLAQYETDAEADAVATRPNNDTPNIIYLQLESFSHPSHWIGVQYSEDPAPNYTRLREQFPAGALYVPVLGGGTANTELEILAGMNVDFFGAAEFPYNTVLRETPCESVASILRARGYRSTAIHNHAGTFYYRNQVYANMGFDAFISVEYMSDVTRNALGWARDDCLIDEIMHTLRASEAPDFIMGITVELHGAYDAAVSEGEGLSLLTWPDELDPAALHYYGREMKIVDQFLGDLLDELAAYEEPVVCVVYGDHLPELWLTAENIDTGNLYQTEYVIWNNYGASFEAPDKEAYQMTSSVLNQLGVTEGVLNRYHQVKGDETDLEALAALQYDMLYGERIVYRDTPLPPPVATAMQLGRDPIEVMSVHYAESELVVRGRHFTPSSVVYLDDQAFETTYEDETTLRVPDVTRIPVSVRVAQVTWEGETLTWTAPYFILIPTDSRA